MIVYFKYDANLLLHNALQYSFQLLFSKIIFFYLCNKTQLCRYILAKSNKVSAVQILGSQGTAPLKKYLIVLSSSELWGMYFKKFLRCTLCGMLIRGIFVLKNHRFGQILQDYKFFLIRRLSSDNNYV